MPGKKRDFNFYKGWLLKLSPFILIASITISFLWMNIIAGRSIQNEIGYDKLVELSNSKTTENIIIHAKETRLEIIVKETPTQSEPQKQSIYSMPIQEGTQLDSINSILRDKKANLQKIDFFDLRSTGVGYLFQKYSGLLFWGSLIFLALVMMRRNSGGAFNSIGKSKAKTYDPKEKRRYTFQDVAGLEDAKIEARELITALRDPKQFEDMGARIPKGAIFIGPPGTGKTLLAKAIAGETGENVVFLFCSAAEFVKVFVGAGAETMRDFFNKARKITEEGKKVILFVDELDALGKAREKVSLGGHNEYEHTLNQLLTEMDGFETNEGIIFVGATNRYDTLDPALIRPGRFDRTITFDLPLVKDRLAILELHAQRIRRGDNLDLKTVAIKTFQSSGADLENIVNEATYLAVREHAPHVEQRHFDEAIDRVHLGAKRKSITISREQKERIAIHEAGHALVAYHLEKEGGNRVELVSIEPRRFAGGYVRTIADEDVQIFSQKQIEAEIAMGLGSYAAEHKIYGDNCRGVSADLKQITELAHNMVTKWGMSGFGPQYVGTPYEGYYETNGGKKENSQALLQKVEKEMNAIIQKFKEKAERIITENIDALHELRDALIVRERIEREEFLTIVKKSESTRKKNAE